MVTLERVYSLLTACPVSPALEPSGEWGWNDRFFCPQLLWIRMPKGRNSRKTAWFPPLGKMRPLPATASQGKSPVPP